ncbi:phage tail protein [Duganella sp. Dugasp56]|uniref:phage tail protein n=1 Tax=Duganella sp. Dugasp56 TaxID=3243046 RepID=UPI00159DBF40
MHSALPVGVIMPYAGRLAKDDDSQANIRQIKAQLASTGWMFCDGSPLDPKDFPRLYGVLQFDFGKDAKGHFLLPDLRGQFIRGVSETPVQDPDRCSRATPRLGKGEGPYVGSVQRDAFQGHQHDYTSLKKLTPLIVEEGSTPLDYTLAEDTSTSAYVADGDYGKPRPAQETRPVNLYLNYIIFVGRPFPAY